LPASRAPRTRPPRAARSPWMRCSTRVSVGTTFKAELEKAGVIFCSISEAIKEHPELVKKYLGSVVPVTDNFFATLNSAVFSDGSFVYVPPGVRCPMELSHLFPHQRREHRPVRAHADHRRQGVYVSYSKAAPRRSATPPAARRGGGDGRAGRCGDQVFHRAELVSGRRERQGRHLQLRHQARRLPGRPVQGDVDAGGNRLGRHVEIPVLHPARR
jgi:hypothetical protein